MEAFSSVMEDAPDELGLGEMAGRGNMMDMPEKEGMINRAEMDGKMDRTERDGMNFSDIKDKNLEQDEDMVFRDVKSEERPQTGEDVGIFGQIINLLMSIFH